MDDVIYVCDICDNGRYICSCDCLNADFSDEVTLCKNFGVKSNSLNIFKKIYKNIRYFLNHRWKLL